MNNSRMLLLEMLKLLFNRSISLIPSLFELRGLEISMMTMKRAVAGEGGCQLEHETQASPSLEDDIQKCPRSPKMTDER